MPAHLLDIDNPKKIEDQRYFPFNKTSRLTNIKVTIYISFMPVLDWTKFKPSMEKIKAVTRAAVLFFKSIIAN